MHPTGNALVTYKCSSGFIVTHNHTWYNKVKSDLWNGVVSGKKLQVLIKGELTKSGNQTKDPCSCEVTTEPPRHLHNRFVVSVFCYVGHLY